MRALHHCVFALFLYNKLSLLIFGGEIVNNNKKNAKMHFFKLSSSFATSTVKLNNKLEELYNYFISKEFSKIPSIKFGSEDDESTSEVYYIQSMEKRSLDSAEVDDYYYWLLTISKVSIGEAITIADISQEINKRRKSITHDENEGIIKGSWMIYDPWRLISVNYTPRGAVNRYEIKRFLNNLAGTRGLAYEAILTKNAYSRFDNFSNVNKFTYKLASPDKFNAFKKEERTEKQDLKFAQKMASSELEIVLSDTQLPKNVIKDKIKKLLNTEDIEIKKLTIDGLNDGERDFIDFVKNFLVFEGAIEYKDYLDDKAVFGFLNKGYDENSDYLESIYDIKYVKVGEDEKWQDSKK